MRNFVSLRGFIRSFRRSQGDFAACGRRVSFPAMGKKPKDRRGTAQDGHFVSIFALPPVPHYGGYPLEQAESFRRAKSEWVSEFPPGHWALGLQKLPLLRFHSCAWVVQTNVPGSVSTVGAGVLTRPPRNVLIGA